MGIKPFDKDVEENNKRLMLSYVPEHDGAKGEWMEQSSKKDAPHDVVGMSLRDFIATQAMMGLLAKCHPDQLINKPEIVADAYGLADAMLKERNR